MTINKININSLKCVRIEILAENTKVHLSWGSGCLCKTKNHAFLLTNWHIVSGRNFQTNEPLHNSGAIPGSLNLTFHTVRNNPDGSFYHDECLINIDLFDSTTENGEEVFNNKPIYKIHPKFGSKIDVALVDLTNIFKEHPEIEFVAYDLDQEDKNVELFVMDEVFIAGFPLKNTTTPNNYPIYKNATIASEPDAFDDLPMFYVDGKTKSGMSGSPVIKRTRFEITKEEGKAIAHPVSVNLIGLYSGRDRQEDDEYQAELGIVWRYRECLIPLIKNAFS